MSNARIDTPFGLNRVHGALGSRAVEVDTPGGADRAYAAVAIVLAGTPDAPAVCFAERAARADDRWSGDVAFPGGWGAPGDADHRATAMRETREELGLDLAPSQWVGDLCSIPVSRHGDDARPLAASVFYVGPVCPALEPDQHEIVDGFWVPGGHLLDPANRTTVRWSRRGTPEPHPAIEFDGRVIWGLTFRVLQRLLDEVATDRPA